MTYCVMAFWYELTRGIPFMWIPWAWTDLIFFILFLFAWKTIGGFVKAGLNFLISRPYIDLG